MRKRIIVLVFDGEHLDEQDLICREKALDRRSKETDTCGHTPIAIFSPGMELFAALLSAAQFSEPLDLQKVQSALTARQLAGNPTLAPKPAVEVVGHVVPLARAELPPEANQLPNMDDLPSQLEQFGNYDSTRTKP